MNWFRRFMVGRYGTDKLNMVLLIVSIVITAVGGLTGVAFLVYISYLFVFLCVYRMFSRNIYARVNENRKFFALFAGIKHIIDSRLAMVKGGKTHRYYKCKLCKQRVRVPKGRGKIEITCPKCNNKFIKKS